MRNKRSDFGKARTHGDTSGGRTHPIYRAWCHMIERCYKKNTKYYEYYGGIGVTVCDEWRDDYLSFKQWSIDNGWKQGLEIDKDFLSGENKTYSPSTCRWVTHIENCQHTETKAGKTGIKGISQDKRKKNGKSFFGQKVVYGKKIQTKYFHTPEEAKNELDKLVSQELGRNLVRDKG